jgi:hypothetical protein
MNSLTLEEAILLSPSDDRDEIYPDVFNDDCGLSEKSPEGYTTSKNWKTKRKVVLDIDSWKGISIGAIHYYGKFIIDGVQSISSEGHSFWSSGYHKNLMNSRYYLKIHRRLTKEELEKDPDRWRWYDEGDLVTGFESITELKKLAIEIFKLRFSGKNWKLYYQHSGGDIRPLN